MTDKQFWKGSRGEWYLVVQGCLFLLLLFGPHTWQGMPVWSAPYTSVGRWGGIVLLVEGILLAAAGSLTLGRNLTPLPVPKEHATLIVTGVYRLVRHPIYSGITLMAFGWGMWLNSWLTFVYALLLLLFFDVKSRHEERLLGEKFPEYADYRTRVKKLIPYLY
jgi:protein-S-isoprenylcysteine O-methyltransferase Ste14